MGKIQSMHIKVERILELCPKTRDNDCLLVGTIYKNYYDFDVNTRLARDMLLSDKLPSWETITRCRRKVQEERPDLRGSREARERRMTNQKSMLEYARR